MTRGTAAESSFDRTLRSWERPRWWHLFVLAPWAIGVAHLTYAWYGNRVIAQRQATTQGTIIRHDPGNHDRYGYSFSVGGESYGGWHIPSGAEEPRIGDQVMVYYDPRDPRTSALVSFDEQATRHLRPLPLLVGGIMLVALYITLRRIKIAQHGRGLTTG